MILYFSGTGNSKYVAKRLGTYLNDEVRDMGARIKKCDFSSMKSNKPWIIVFPTYAWRMPRIVRTFLRRTKLNGRKEIYFVMTCGAGIGNARIYNTLLAIKKHMNDKGTASVVMPENYIAMFDSPDETTAKKIVIGAESKIMMIASVIREGEILRESVSPIGHLESGIVNTLFYKLYIKDRKFTVDDSCSGCGQCAKLCPLSNISIKDGKPFWNGNCTHCMACICHCPKEAIEYGKKSVGRFRYKCPEA